MGIGKKICCLSFVFLLLAGCSASSVTGDAQGQKEDDSDGYITIGYSQVGSESDWRMANTASAKATFSTENGYDLIFDDAQQKQENQLKAIRNFILQEVDYIILDPIVESGWNDVLTEAKEAGIPVIIADRCVEVEDESLYTCWVGSDFEKEGEDAAKWLADYLESKGRTEETINIVTLQGTLDSSAQIGRTNGFAKEMQEHENWVMLDEQTGDFTQTKGQEVMEEYLQAYSDIDVLVSENDNMTFGAIEAIKNAGREYGSDGGIIIISFDATHSALEAMQRGEINADFECNPLTGPVIADVIQSLRKGETVEKYIYMTETYFDSSMDLTKAIAEREY